MISEPVDRGGSSAALGHPALRPAIGLGLPALLVVATLPWLSTLHAAPLGVPLALWWLGLCIPLTSACLAVVWFVFDSHAAAAPTPAATRPGPPGHAHDSDVS